MIIPQISKYRLNNWTQPDPNDIIIEGRYAYMEKLTFEKLKNYEYSNPTGIYTGKMWRRGNVLCFVIPDFYDKDYGIIVKREILIL